MTVRIIQFNLSAAIADRLELVKQALETYLGSWDIAVEVERSAVTTKANSTFEEARQVLLTLEAIRTALYRGQINSHDGHKWFEVHYRTSEGEKRSLVTTTQVLGS